MALFAVYHFGHVIGTWLIIRANNAAEAHDEARKILNQPGYHQPSLVGRYLYQVATSDAREEEVRRYFHRKNIEAIKNGII